MSKSVYIYSRGKFEELNEIFLHNKCIIRFHNINDEKWYSSTITNGLVFFFNDLKINNLTFIDKIKAEFFSYNKKYNYFTKKDAIKLIEFIKKNKEKDFVIHCEFGKSRSVAVALYLKYKYNYKIENKEKKELTFFNDWMLFLLKKYT